MTSQHTKSNIISSLFWKLMERGAAQGIQLAVQIVLARVLAPEQFGTIAIVMVFVNLARVFVQSGFSTALIQKKDADSEDFSSVFYLSLAVAGVSYVIIFISAPYISLFYAMPVLEPVLRVIALNLFAGAFNSVQNAFVARNLLFKKLFMSSLGAVLISGTLGVACAYRGFGIWAIVIQQLANQAAVTAIMWFTVRWRPELIFSISRVRELFAFGSRLLISKLIETLYRELSTLIIGRMYTSDTLGYYSRGQLFPQLVVSNIDGSIQSVMLPALSAHQDNQKRVKEMMRRAVVSSSFIRDCDTAGEPSFWGVCHSGRAGFCRHDSVLYKCLAEQGASGLQLQGAAPGHTSCASYLCAHGSRCISAGISGSCSVAEVFCSGHLRDTYLHYACKDIQDRELYLSQGYD